MGNISHRTHKLEPDHSPDPTLPPLSASRVTQETVLDTAITEAKLSQLDHIAAFKIRSWDIHAGKEATDRIAKAFVELLDSGCPIPEVEALVKRIGEYIFKFPPVRTRTASHSFAISNAISLGIESKNNSKIGEYFEILEDYIHKVRRDPSYTLKAGRPLMPWELGSMPRPGQDYLFEYGLALALERSPDLESLKSNLITLEQFVVTRLSPDNNFAAGNKNPFG